jgi:hypothetical protein
MNEKQRKDLSNDTIEDEGGTDDVWGDDSEDEQTAITFGSRLTLDPSTSSSSGHSRISVNSKGDVEGGEERSKRPALVAISSSATIKPSSLSISTKEPVASKSLASWAATFIPSVISSALPLSPTMPTTPKAPNSTPASFTTPQQQLSNRKGKEIMEDEKTKEQLEQEEAEKQSKSSPTWEMDQFKAAIHPNVDQLVTGSFYHLLLLLSLIASFTARIDKFEI